MFILIVDQWSKYWAETKLQPVIMIDVIEGFFRFTYALNRGVAFSMFADSALNVRVIFAAISSAAALFVIFYFIKTPDNKTRLLTALSLLLAGITGNLIDRVRLGVVIDFLDFHLGNNYTWPTFNVADAAICIGAGLMALDMLLEERHLTQSKNVS